MEIEFLLCSVRCMQLPRVMDQFIVVWRQDAGTDAQHRLHIWICQWWPVLWLVYIHTRKRLFANISWSEKHKHFPVKSFKVLELFRIKRSIEFGELLVLKIVLQCVVWLQKKKSSWMYAVAASTSSKAKGQLSRLNCNYIDLKSGNLLTNSSFICHITPISLLVNVQNIGKSVILFWAFLEI